MASVDSSVGAFLSRAGIDKREAQMLAAHVLGVSRASIIAHTERVLDASQQDQLQALLSRRAAGEPVAYLLGTREFYGREFVVSPATLIPRPETEILVEQALARLSGQKCSETRANPRVLPSAAMATPSILDLGTGSGAFAVSLALERPDATVVAVDISPGALKIATENAQRLSAKVQFIESSWYDALGDAKFDLIASNPPYVAADDVHLSQGDLRFEPQIALTDRSPDGMQSIRTIIEGARTRLNDGGWLLFEHGYDQADACRALLEKNGFTNLQSICDLSGIPRVAGGQIR